MLLSYFHLRGSFKSLVDVLVVVLPSIVGNSHSAVMRMNSPGASPFGPAPDARGGRDHGLTAAVLAGRPARRLRAVLGSLLEEVLLKLAGKRMM